MKMAWICTESLPAPAIRGGAIQTMIDGAAPYLEKHHELTIFSVADPDLPNEETRGKVRYIRIPATDYVNGVSRRLAAESFEAVHVFNRPKSIPIYFAATPSSRFFLSLHNEMMHENKISEETGKMVISLVDGITTVSQYIKNTVVQRFPEAEPKIQIVYSGVNLNDYPPVWSKRGREIRRSVRERNRLNGRKVILFAGRLSKNKGADVLVKAMPAVLQKHPDAILIIAGGKWFSDNRINRYIRKLYRDTEPIKDRVIFTQFIPISKMPELFLAADLFVCPSQWQEPLARVHYEAMAAGIPVITTNRGGNGEVILHEQNGLLIEDYNKPEALANAINHCLSYPEKAKWMALNGRNFVETNFQFSHVADRLDRAYRTFVGTSR
ncbi:MAG TPA: glycosyltransferase family 4 protein [Bacillales bacterium]|nr:glycosyltransferase family 4 protein [Bacillales bacterium]